MESAIRGNSSMSKTKSLIISCGRFRLSYVESEPANYLVCPRNPRVITVVRGERSYKTCDGHSARQDLNYCVLVV